MDIRELISFYHTARLFSVSSAASYLNLGQPTVSTHLRRLEKEMGVQLFDRLRHPIRLTAEGNNLFESVGPVVRAVERGLESLKAQISDPIQQGSFSIGAYPDLALNYLPPVLREYRGRYSEAHIKVVARPYEVLMDMLNAGDIDMAVVHAPERENQTLAFEKLFDAPFMLVTPVGHPLLEEPEPSLESICRWPLILLSRDSYTRCGFEQLHRNKLGLSIDLSMPEGVALFKEVVAISDVVMENFSFGVMERLGLGYRELCRVRPDIIMISMPAFGGSGPHRDYVAFGWAQQHMAGITATTGYPGGPPLKSGTIVADPLNGVHAAGRSWPHCSIELGRVWASSSTFPSWSLLFPW